MNEERTGKCLRQVEHIRGHLIFHRFCSICCNHNHVLSSSFTYLRVNNKSNMSNATSGAVTDYHSGEPEFAPGF